MKSKINRKITKGKRKNYAQIIQLKMSEGVIELYFLARERKEKYRIQKTTTLKDLRQSISVPYCIYNNHIEGLPLRF